MIFHASIPADDPERVAAVIAELWIGRSLQFHPVEGAFIAFADDLRGSAIEVYPRRCTLAPGQQMLTVRSSARRARAISTHLAVGSPLTLEKIVAVANREQWRGLICSRGPYEVIELWLENAVLLELMTAKMLADNRAWMSSDNWAGAS